jgi:hypothetical protein
VTDDRIAEVLMDLAHGGAGGRLLPLGGGAGAAADWRPLMPEVRRVAAALPLLRATQKGVAVDPAAAQGPIRLGLP